MANLSSFTSKILNEESGETVRDSIINAVNYISNNGSNSSSLNGIPADKFATASDWDRYKRELDPIVKFDTIEELEENDAYSQTSIGVMSSYQMFRVLVKYIRPSLKKIMNYEVDPEDNKLVKEAIFDYLDSFKIGKDSIFDALVSKGQDVDSADCFRDVADMILNIGEENPVLVTQTLNEEKKYTLDKNEQGKMQAYSKVTVNVPNKTETGSGSENNHTYTPSPGKLFSSFRVNVNAQAQSASSRYGGGRGGSAGSGSAIDDNGIMSELSITENNDYIASESGVEGWSSVSVHVEAPQISAGTMFTVRFKEKADSADILGEVQVAPYGTARFDVTPNPPASNLIFAGWEPPPTRVIEDMDVVARFKTKKAASNTEIDADWTTIIACRGADYDVGQYKTWEMGTVGGNNYGTMIFQKVAEGEDGTTSTWLSKTVTNVGGSIGHNWAISNKRTFWNTTFFDDLPNMDYGQEFLSAIMPVRKKSVVFWGQELSLIESTVEVETIDRMWVPSAAEMWGGVPANIMEQIVKYYMNDLKPDGTYIDRSAFRDSHFEIPNPGPNVESGRFETRYTDYSPAFDGVVYSTAESTGSGNRLNYVITPNTVENYIKYRSTNNSTAEGYRLRTIRGYGYATGSGTPIPASWGISNTGGAGTQNTDWVPIGFCL